MSVRPADILLSPYTLGDLKLKNRIVMAPLTRTRATVPPRSFAVRASNGISSGLAPK